MKQKIGRRLQAVVLAFVLFVSMFQGIPGLEIDWAEKAEAAVTLRWPVPGHTGLSRGLHDKNAIDISDGGIGGAQVVAALGGTVIKKTTCSKKHYGSYGDCNGFGTGLVIKGDDGRTYQYAHMQAGSIPGGINVGSRVSIGQVIGKVGTTGNSSGNHLHFGICYGNYWEGSGNPSNEKYVYNSVPVDQSPQGCLDDVSSSPGQVRVAGWVFDRDNNNTAVKVHVYIDGPAGSGKCIGMGYADKSRPDVNKVYGTGNNHGFDFSVNTNYVGNHRIYVHAINIGKDGKDNGGNNPVFGNKSVNIKPQTVYTVNTGGVANIKNKDAQINGSLSPNGNANSWGFYIGTSENQMTRCTVSASATASSNMSAQIAKYYSLKPGTKYYYRTWAWVNDQEKKGSVSSFTTTSVKPDIPVVKTDSGSKNIGIGDAPSISWNAVDQADSYKVYLYDGNGEQVQTAENITGTKYAFKAVETSGTYTAMVEAVNEIGSKGMSEPTEIEVHPDVTVKFMDADSFVDMGEDYKPEIISEQQVHWGKAANKPADPSHTGYQFKKWDKSYADVKEDTVVKAVYEIKQYTVKYVDSNTKETLKTEKVDYYSAGSPPDYEVPSYYAKTGFDGWDKDYKHITEDTTLYSCTGWYNADFPIYAQIKSAVREYDAEESDNEGYTVVAKMRNNDESTTKGRVVVALKTEKGKLLTTTESSAFSIKKGSEKELEIFVPYDKAAAVAEIYVVGQYKDAVPITTTASNNATLEIDQSNTYTDWSTEEPPENVRKKESREEYRYSDKSTKETYNTSEEGYTQNGSRWVQSGGGSVNYVNSFPSGLSRSNGYYRMFNNTPPVAYENATNKRTISTSHIGYLYYHWCRGWSGGPINRKVSDCYTSEFNTCHAYFHSGGALGYNSSAGAFQESNPVECRDTYWWLGSYCWNANQTPVYSCKYTDYRKLFSYYKWSDYSAWSTNAVSESSTRKVEKRTVYRYQSDEMMQQDDSGKERTVKGTLGAEFAGKEATLFIYKVDEASDYTNEYVAQQKLGDNGSYEFTFKLREEPTADTGDYTISLGIEGASTSIYLDKIEAPKKEYTVKFFDYNGKLLSTEKVKEGENAPLPDEDKLERLGYTFSKWTDTNLNITEDKEIYAEYKINEYNVVFVDWGASTVEVKKFEYGSTLVAPQPAEPDESEVVEWDAIADGKMIVTSDLIVCTRYAKKECSVTVKDFDNKIIKEEKVSYGNGVDLPVLDGGDDKIFLGWKDISEGGDAGITDTIITKNVILCPVYTYEETVKTPKASLKSGSYNEVKRVSLTCETEDADIYYTLDGTNPKSYGATLYTGPIEIDDAVRLQFYACKAGMNDSDIQSEMYTVNYNGAVSKWMTKDELPKEVTEHMSDYTINTDTGYTYKETKKTSLVSEASMLENNGWEVEAEDEYTEYSEWKDSMPEDDGTHIAVDVDTKAVYSTAYQYKYSHYVYEDGTTEHYAAEELDGVESKLEETKPFDKALSVAGFDENDNPYYVYDGKIWYNQKKVAGQVQTGNKYRSRYKVVTYTKWSDYTLTEPAEDETKQFKSATVFNYVRHNKYIVRIHAVADSLPEETSLFVEEGNTVSEESYTDVYGYSYDGMYTDSAYTKKWDAESSTVSEDMDLYIKYTKKKYKVTFTDEEGNEIASQEVAYKDAATAPEVEDKKGYRFVGWADDSYKSVEYDMEVMAKFVAEDEYATVSLDNESISLYVGKATDLTAIIKPASKSDAELEWSSSDSDVAEISEDGRVTGVGEGKAVITVKITETGETATCNVIVKANTDTTLSILKNSKLNVDQYGYLRGLKAGNCKVKDVCNEFANDTLICLDLEGNELKDSDSMGTGCVINLMAGKKVMDSLTVVVTGDLSGDGAVSNRDVSMLARMLLEKEVPTDPQILAGDVNGDGEVGNKDVVMLSKIRLGKESLK